MKVNLQPTLTNELVTIRPVSKADFEALYLAANDPLIWELHQNPDRYELSVFKQFFEEAIKSNAAFVIIDKVTKKIIGSSRYKISEASKEAIEIGWTFLSREYWGGIYNQSFKSLLISYAFQYFEFITFHVDQNNLRSQKAVTKLGGVLINREGKLSHLHTSKKSGITYVLRKSEWSNN